MERSSQFRNSINRWPRDDQPREKLIKHGEHTLTNSELLAILLRTGVKGHSAVDLARTVMSKFKTFRHMSHTDFREWKEMKGLGPAKISQIKAAIEIGRRFREDEQQQERLRVKSSKDVVDILMPRMRDLKKEIFKAVLLNSQNKIMAIRDMAEGTVDQANPVIREIFQVALAHFAVSVICVHNHPSGCPVPSAEDRIFTRKLFEAGKIMGIKVLDHVIIGDDQYYSFADEGI